MSKETLSTARVDPDLALWSPPTLLFGPDQEISPSLFLLNKKQERRLTCLTNLLKSFGYISTPQELAWRLTERPLDSSFDDPFALPEKVLSSLFSESFRFPTYRTSGELAGTTVENTARVLRHLGMVHANSFLQLFYGLSLNDLLRPNLHHPAFAHLKEEQREALSNFRSHLANLFKTEETSLNGKRLEEYAATVVELQQIDGFAQWVKEEYPNMNVVGFIPLINGETGRLAGIIPEIREGQPRLRLKTLRWLTDKLLSLSLRSKRTTVHPPDPLSYLPNQLIEFVDSMRKSPLQERKPAYHRLTSKLAALIAIAGLGLPFLSACTTPEGLPTPPPPTLSTPLAPSPGLACPSDLPLGAPSLQESLNLHGDGWACKVTQSLTKYGGQGEVDQKEVLGQVQEEDVGIWVRIKEGKVYEVAPGIVLADAKVLFGNKSDQPAWVKNVCCWKLPQKGIVFLGEDQDQLRKLVESIMGDQEMEGLCQEEVDRITMALGHWPIDEEVKEAMGTTDVLPDRTEITILDLQGMQEVYDYLHLPKKLQQELPEELWQKWAALHELCHACAQGEQEFSLEQAEEIGITVNDLNVRSIRTEGFKMFGVDGQGNSIGGNKIIEEIICGIQTRHEAFLDPELKILVPRDDFSAPNYEGFIILLDSASGRVKGQIYEEIWRIKEKGDIVGLWRLIKERTKEILEEAGYSDLEAGKNATHVARMFISYGVGYFDVREADRRFAEVLVGTGLFTSGPVK